MNTFYAVVALQLGLSTLLGVEAPGDRFVNAPAPELIAEKWLHPAPDLTGKFVLLDFWATWCPACRHSIPRLNGFESKFSDKLAVIGLSAEREEAVNKLADPRPTYALAIDPQRRTQTRAGVTAIPHLLVIDPDGIVRWEGDPRHLSEVALETMLKGWHASPTNHQSLVVKQVQVQPLVVPSVKTRLRLELKDGRHLEGELVGSFGNRIALLTTDGKQVDLRENEIAKREELKAAKSPGTPNGVNPWMSARRPKPAVGMHRGLARAARYRGSPNGCRATKTP